VEPFLNPKIFWEIKQSVAGGGVALVKWKHKCIKQPPYVELMLQKGHGNSDFFAARRYHCSALFSP